MACHAHDILDSFPELNTDARLAGWRLKQPAGGVEGEQEAAAAAAVAEEPVLVDTHKQGPAVGDVVEYALPPHLVLDDGRCVSCRCALFFLNRLNGDISLDRPWACTSSKPDRIPTPNTPHQDQGRGRAAVGEP